jgi:enamine deaminase RidA (YjgF/YER057c/UK114 family)
MNNYPINSERAPEAVGAYPHARRVGNLLFVSGVGPRERGQKAIPGVTYFVCIQKHTLCIRRCRSTVGGYC